MRVERNKKISTLAAIIRFHLSDLFYEEGWAEENEWIEHSLLERYYNEIGKSSGWIKLSEPALQALGDYYYALINNRPLIILHSLVTSTPLASSSLSSETNEKRTIPDFYKEILGKPINISEQQKSDKECFEKNKNILLGWALAQFQPNTELVKWLVIKGADIFSVNEKGLPLIIHILKTPGTLMWCSRAWLIAQPAAEAAAQKCLLGLEGLREAVEKYVSESAAEKKLSGHDLYLKLAQKFLRLLPKAKTFFPLIWDLAYLVLMLQKAPMPNKALQTNLRKVIDEFDHVLKIIAATGSCSFEELPPIPPNPNIGRYSLRAFVLVANRIIFNLRPEVTKSFASIVPTTETPELVERFIDESIIIAGMQDPSLLDPANDEFYCKSIWGEVWRNLEEIAKNLFRYKPSLEAREKSSALWRWLFENAKRLAERRAEYEAYKAGLEKLFLPVGSGERDIFQYVAMSSGSSSACVRFPRASPDYWASDITEEEREKRKKCMQDYLKFRDFFTVASKILSSYSTGLTGSSNLHGPIKFHVEEANQLIEGYRKKFFMSEQEVIAAFKNFYLRVQVMCQPVPGAVPFISEPSDLPGMRTPDMLSGGRITTSTPTISVPASLLPLVLHSEDGAISFVKAKPQAGAPMMGLMKRKEQTKAPTSEFLATATATTISTAPASDGSKSTLRS